MKRTTVAGIGVVLALASGAAGCRPVAKAIVNDGWEESIGETVSQEFVGQYTLLPTTDPVHLWADQLVQHLAQAAEPLRSSSGYNGYKVRVIDDNDFVNAFAAPGGFVYVSTGLIKEASHCAEVAGVLSHELAHVTNRHGIEAVSDRLVINFLASYILGSGLASSATQVLAATSFSRSQETEADKDGMRILADSGYNPRGMSDFFGKLAESEGSLQRALTLVSTHPSSEKRMARMQVLAESIESDYALDSLDGTACLGTTMDFDDVLEAIGGQALPKD